MKPKSVLAPAGSAIFPLAILTALTLAPSALAAGQQTSVGNQSWVAGYKAKARLIAGGHADAPVDGALLAGVHLKLEKGWKTYWRHPGDSGVPPVFEWTGSQNLKKAEILYPAPRRFPDQIGASIGYEDEVVFPVLIVPEDQNQPVNVNLNLNYGVCKDICVPEQAKLSAVLKPLNQKAGDKNEDRQILSAYLTKVPATKAQIGQGDNQISSLKTVFNGPTPHIMIDVRFAPNANTRDLFAEMADGSYLPLPEKVAQKSDQDPALSQFRIDLSQADETVSLKGKILILTLVSSKGSTETRLKLTE